MDLTFKTRKLEKVFNSERVLKTTYGSRMARTIAIRLAVLRNARDLAMIPTQPPERRHQLSGKRSGQYAVDLVHPHRLVFQPNHDPVPRLADGGIDAGHVTAITIVEVIDYH